MSSSSSSSLVAPATTARPRVCVCRDTFPETIAHLREYFDVSTNDDDVVWLGDETLLSHVKGCVGIFSTGSEKLNANVIRACCPELKVIANMGVGINHIGMSLSRLSLLRTHTHTHTHTHTAS